MADNYEYMNEASIDNSLKCILCSEPFINPYSTLCNHTFCLSCITKSIEEHDRCPTCGKRSISIQGVKPFINSSIHDLLDRLLVQCRLCRQSNIPRSSFSEHATQTCPKRIVNCSAIDLKCPWQGPQDEFEIHSKQCHYEIMRPLLGNLLDTIQSLSNRVQRNEECINSLVTENQQLQHANRSLIHICRQQYQSIRDIKSQQHQLKEKLELVEILSNPNLNHNPRLNEILSPYRSYSSIILTDLRLNNFDISFIIQQAVISKQCSALILSNNSIGTIGIEILSNTLRTNLSLRRLSLKGNQVNGKGVEYLSNALSINNTLEMLDLEANNIFDSSSMHSLAKIIRSNQRLKELYLGYNRIDNQGMDILANAFHDKSTIEIFSVNGNKLDDQCLPNIDHMFNTTNLKLQKFDLCGNMFSLQGKTKLLQIGYSKRKSGFKLNV